MKISEMTCEQASNALVRMSGPIANLVDDPEMQKILDSLTEMKKQRVAPGLATAKLIPQFITLGLKHHKKDVFEIAGALLNETAANIAKMNLLAVIREVTASFDEDFTSFFTSSAAAAKKGGASSSVPSSATAGTDGTRSDA